MQQTGLHASGHVGTKAAHYLNLPHVPTELELAISDFWTRFAFAQRMSQTESFLEEFSITEGDIVIDYYFGLSALVHNQSYFGFFKKRGAINW